MSLTVWFTGLSGAGKTTLSVAVEQRLKARGFRTQLLDGDVIREFISPRLAFDKEARDENVLRIGFIGRLLAQHGVIALASVISPYRATREAVRRAGGEFVEVYVNASLAACESRDVKGLYRRARAGEIHGFTGIDDPYEPPLAPEIECWTDQETVDQSAQKVIDYLEAKLSGVSS
jgi:adenylyl-sulfate kinase